MKTTKKILTYIIAGALASSSVSCKKFLELQPISNSTDQTFWRTETDANKGSAAMYALLRKSMHYASGLSFYAYGDLPADEYSTNLFRFSDVGNINWSVSVPGTDTFDAMLRLRRYDTFYSTIDQANRCLKLISDIPDGAFSSVAAKNNYLGEAYFMRAFNYFYMARVWGDVPLVTESLNVAEAVDIPRTSQDQVLAQCQKDVNEAIRLLDWTYKNASDRPVRANKGAAYALLAHLSAWKGDYNACKTACDAILNSNIYSYVDRQQLLTIYKGKTTEGIFEVAASDENEGSVYNISHVTLKAPYLPTNTANAAFTINQTTLRRLFTDTADTRYKNAFAFRSSTDPICIKYNNVTINNGQNGVASVVSKNNLIVFRLADIALLKAEACCALAQFNEARTVLNGIRTRAGIQNYAGTDATLLREVTEERGRELFLEGHRFYDLIRYARLSTDFNFFGSKINSAEFAQGKYYWPMDPSLLNINKRLTQTSFWRTKM